MRKHLPRVIEGKPGAGVTEDTLETIRGLVADDARIGQYDSPAPTIAHRPIPRAHRRAFEPDATAPPPRYVYSREEGMPPPQPVARPAQPRFSFRRVLASLFT